VCVSITCWDDHGAPRSVVSLLFTTWSIDIVLMCSSTMIVSLITSLNAVNGVVNMERVFLASLTNPTICLNSVWGLCNPYNLWIGVQLQELQYPCFYFHLPLIRSRPIDVSKLSWTIVVYLWMRVTPTCNVNSNIT